LIAIIAARNLVVRQVADTVSLENHARDEVVFSLFVGKHEEPAEEAYLLVSGVLDNEVPVNVEIASISEVNDPLLFEGRKNPVKVGLVPDPLCDRYI